MSGNFSRGSFSPASGGFSVDALPVVVVGGSGAGDGAEDAYAEPRRVMVRGKPYTVRSKNEYLGLLARGKRDQARESADAAIARSQDTARAALDARKVDEATEETAMLLHALLARQEEASALAEKNRIPVQIMMMVAADL